MKTNDECERNAIQNGRNHLLGADARHPILQSLQSFMSLCSSTSLVAVPAVVQANLIVRSRMCLVFWGDLGRVIHQAEDRIRAIC